MIGVLAAMGAAGLALAATGLPIFGKADLARRIDLHLGRREPSFQWLRLPSRVRLTVPGSESSRTKRIEDQLPAAIDLLTLCVLAGESIPGAIGRVARELHGDLPTELERVVYDLRDGMTLASALDGLAARVDATSVARLVDALQTAADRGAPVADVLRSQADDLRARRNASLLEIGGRREVLMLVPVVFLILPVVVMFALLPGLVSLDLIVP